VDFGTGGVYGLQPARKVVPSDREWFTKTIVAHGNHMAVWVNGYPVSDFTDIRPLGRDARSNCRLEAGPISLQGHDPTTDLSFRNIRMASYTPEKPEPGKETAYGDVFYYCTNCKKEFTASSVEVPPIKCKFCGKVAAVLATKFKCKECGSMFIGYIEKFDPETQRLIEMRKRGERVPDEKIGNVLVSDPEKEEWLDATSLKGMEVTHNVVCPKCCGTDLKRVFPKPYRLGSRTGAGMHR